jgi:hypothetical protein
MRLGFLILGIEVVPILNCLGTNLKVLESNGVESLITFWNKNNIYLKNWVLRLVSLEYIILELTNLTLTPKPNFASNIKK